MFSAIFEAKKELFLLIQKSLRWAHLPTEERPVIEPTPGVHTRQLCNFKFFCAYSKYLIFNLNVTKVTRTAVLREIYIVNK